MSIRTYCAECDEQTVDGVLRHAVDCSANKLQARRGIEYLRQPATRIEFDSPAEQVKFMANLSKGSGTADYGLNTPNSGELEVVRVSPENSASANASPVEHKHKAPPTPTIESILLKFAQGYTDSTHRENVKPFDNALETAVADVALLITKAEQNAQLDLMAALRLQNPDQKIVNWANGITAQLKAPKPDQERNEDE